MSASKSESPPKQVGISEHHDKSLQALMSALAFSSEDLSANRTGTLSEMQHWRLRARRRRSIIIGVAVILVAVLIATGLIFIGQQNDNGILSILGIAVTLCSAAMTGTFARFWMRINGDIQSREVVITQGTLERVVKPVTRRVVNTIIRVDDVELLVSKEAFDAMAHNHPYALYRTPHTGTLLAAEPL